MQDDTKPVPPTKGQGRTQSKKKGPSSQDARTKLAELKAKEELAKLEQQMEELDGHEWFVRCRSCHGVGVFLTRHPQGRSIQSDEWFSDYKGVDDKYITSEVNCQECGRSLQVSFPGGVQGGFLPNPRYVQSIKDIEAKRAAAELERKQQNSLSLARMSMVTVDEAN